METRGSQSGDENFDMSQTNQVSEADENLRKEIYKLLEAQPQIDTSKPHAARIYDYFLGGKNHFAADREVAEKSLASIPSGRIGARVIEIADVVCHDRNSVWIRLVAGSAALASRAPGKSQIVPTTGFLPVCGST